ncbi:MAG: site-specific DNA-methyltransferase [Alphaproteobacteria bacterium]
MGMAEPEKMELTSMDIAAEKREELKRCLGKAFPEVFAEGGIDFDQLKRVLGKWVEPDKERFGLSWPGKAECMRIIQQPSVATLRPAREESVRFDETENVYIEGDNLEVLKLLQKAYFGKVKMIYIDPPYNTGNEFIYPDKYSETLETYLAYTGQIDENGKRFSTNSETYGRYHSRWINMMYPRLYLARNLLTEDGIVFISIDNHEVSNLRAICDEIFGEDNFLGNIARSTGQTTGQDSGGLGSSFDFVLVYTKADEVSLEGLALSKKDMERFDAEDERGKYAIDQMRKTGSADRRIDRPNMYYPVYAPDGTEVLPMAPAGYEGRWRFEKPTYDRLISEDFIVWKKTQRNGKEVWWPYVKYYLEGRTKRPSPLWTDLDGNKKAARDLRDLFEGKKVFDYPKPVALLKRMIQIAPNASDDDLILDFFAGSCATAQAVMELNKEDGGNRRFIMVQLPEPTEQGTEAYEAGYASISEIGKDRIRRYIASSKSDSEELLDATPKDPRFGFKAFSLASSNFKLWEGAPDPETEIGRQIDLHIDHLSESCTDEDVLYELLLKSGFPLATKVQSMEKAGKQIFSIEDGALLICLEKEITSELIDALAEANPLQVICLDEAFKGNDQLKANAVQTFKARAQAEESEIVFRTV